MLFVILKKAQLPLKYGKKKIRNKMECPKIVTRSVFVKFCVFKMS